MAKLQAFFASQKRIAPASKTPIGKRTLLDDDHFGGDFRKIVNCRSAMPAGPSARLEAIAGLNANVISMWPSKRGAVFFNPGHEEIFLERLGASSDGAQLSETEVK